MSMDTKSTTVDIGADPNGGIAARSPRPINVDGYRNE